MVCSLGELFPPYKNLKSLTAVIEKSIITLKPVNVKFYDLLASDIITKMRDMDKKKLCSEVQFIALKKYVSNNKKCRKLKLKRDVCITRSTI